MGRQGGEDGGGFGCSCPPISPSALKQDRDLGRFLYMIELLLTVKPDNYAQIKIFTYNYAQITIGPVDPVEPVGYALSPEVDPAAAEPIVAKPI